MLAPRKLTTANVVAMGSSSAGVCSARSAGPASSGAPTVSTTLVAAVSIVPAATERRTPVEVARTEGLRRRDGEARGHAPREAEQEEQQGPRRTDRREGVDAEHAADDDRVGDLVELLDDVADEQGDGEERG